jgi:Bacterial regulatory proteins, lacI family
MPETVALGVPGGSAVRLPTVAVPVSISPRERTVSEGRVPGKRVTIADIARRAGVSKGAVSFALNNRPGLSEVTRRRILSVAGELDWYPNSAARALSAARADVWGLVIARPARTLAAEHYYMELVAGIESVLFPRAVFLLLQVAAGIGAVRGRSRPSSEFPAPSTPLPSLPGRPARRGSCGTPIRGSHGPAGGPGH